MSFPKREFKPATLIDVLQWRALHQPEQVAYSFLEDGTVESFGLTYRELDRRARAVAALLQASEVRGSCALLLYPTGPEFITAFYGCLYAGVIAVPAYPPGFNRNTRRIPALVEDSGATVALTTSAVLGRLEQLSIAVPQLKTVRWIATDVIAGGIEDERQDVFINGDNISFLQYTSGSTMSPRGVMISHSNLLYNLECCYRGWGHTPESIALTWMPHYHDLGLVEGLMTPLYGGFRCVVMSPAAMVQRPLRWMQAISRFRVTHSGGPNFAYELCVRKTTAEERAELDLSCWTVAINGAEMVRNATLKRFADAFAVSGFRWTSNHPCYGLAEATCIVTSGVVEGAPVVCTVSAEALEQNRIEKAAAGRELVGVGRAVLDTKVVIVDPDSHKRCEDHEVGEIWISGPTVAQGYWNKLEETRENFRAYLSDTGEGPFLRTGDLGFMNGDELFITGRLKDMIIIDGRNHYPQDLELTVEQSHPALRAGGSAAFSIELNDTEQLVVVAEIDRDVLSLQSEEVLKAVRRALSEEHEIHAHAITLLRPDGLLKTSSGKKERHSCRNGFLQGTLEQWEVN